MRDQFGPPKCVKILPMVFHDVSKLIVFKNNQYLINDIKRGLNDKEKAKLFAEYKNMSIEDFGLKLLAHGRGKFNLDVDRRRKARRKVRKVMLHQFQILKILKLQIQLMHPIPRKGYQRARGYVSDSEIQTWPDPQTAKKRPLRWL
ncbi:hypothetical protein OROGR_008582 [Orobanche gracilis]